MQAKTTLRSDQEVLWKYEGLVVRNSDSQPCSPSESLLRRFVAMCGRTLKPKFCKTTLIDRDADSRSDDELCYFIAGLCRLEDCIDFVRFEELQGLEQISPDFTDVTPAEAKSRTGTADLQYFRIGK